MSRVLGLLAPPVAVCWAPTLILTEPTKDGLVSGGFTGVEPRRAALGKIVNIDLSTWDLSAEDPKRYPAGGEPENYIDRRKHSEAAAAGLPPLWWLDIQELSSPFGNAPTPSRLPADVCDTDLFRIGIGVYARAPLADWLMQQGAPFVTFSE